MKPEELLQKQVSNYLIDEFPNIPFRVDLVDQLPNRNVGKKVKELHGKWSRGYPDMFIPVPMGKYHGLYIELKASDTVPDTEHTRIQKNYHAVLRYHGYKVEFGCQLEPTKKIIKKYLKKGK